MAPTELKTLNVAGLKTVFPGQHTPDVRPMVKARKLITNKVEKHRNLTARNRQRAVDFLERLPKSGETWHCLMEAATFQPFDIVPALIQLANAPADEVLLTSLNITERHVKVLDQLLTEKQIKKVSLLVSHYFAATEKGQYSAAAEVFNRHGQTIRWARSHAKIVALRFGKQHYVCETSGNLGSCKSAEQLSIFTDAKLYRFHRAWIHEFLEAKQ